MLLAIIMFVVLGGVIPVSSSSRILLVADVDQSDVVSRLVEELSKIPQLEIANVSLIWEFEESSLNSTCEILASPGVSGIIDISFGSVWDRLYQEAAASSIPYLKMDVTNSKLLQVVMDYIDYRKGDDAILLLDNQSIFYESLFNFLEKSAVKIAVANVNAPNKMEEIKVLSPLPQYFIAYGTAKSIVDIYRKVQKHSIVKNMERWIFVATDDRQIDIISQIIPFTGTIPFVISDFSQFSENIENSTFREILTSAMGSYLGQTLLSNLPIIRSGCTNPDSDVAQTNPPPPLIEVKEVAPLPYMTPNDNYLTYTLSAEIIMKSMNSSMPVAQFKNVKETKWMNKNNLYTVKRHFKIGIIISPPWMDYEKDSNGEIIKDPITGKKKLTGYLMELTDKFAEIMNFEYELIETSGYGRYDPETQLWDGLVRNLMDGVIDIAMADITTTNERDEVIDFVSPYFYQTGYAIIFRHPVRERSLFKFMEVLRREVWVSILGALVLTALLLWFLEKYSPFSARNNLHKYTEPVRIFDLKEAFWFATTSFTPQGGGDTPKSISGRILAAAYWLFVVLILATFSANLAAFLTVERMKTSIRNLDELAQQSKINFSVLANSPSHDYFRNLAKAEVDLYHAWRNMSLKNKRDPKKRIWNYPIKEKYQQLLESIEGAGLVKTPGEGFQRVLDDEDGLFAFIFDVTNIRYQFFINCSYSSISEAFGEQPLALGVRQGSSLLRELAETTLILQKENFMDSLENKYWNSSYRNTCTPQDDSEGITLQSLGGVFICTIIGLIISVIVLVYEVLERRRKEKNQVKNVPFKVKPFHHK